ncbi:hypothetical protein LZ30DRAFT_159443 [Colletotrichum cereale]|nr:hypothetical protein LZ30DRAFT_159443 [Colletotrichum cereale]
MRGLLTSLERTLWGSGLEGNEDNPGNRNCVSTVGPRSGRHRYLWWSIGPSRRGYLRDRGLGVVGGVRAVDSRSVCWRDYCLISKQVLSGPGKEDGLAGCANIMRRVCRRGGSMEETTCERASQGARQRHKGKQRREGAYFAGLERKRRRSVWFIDGQESTVSAMCEEQRAGPPSNRKITVGRWWCRLVFLSWDGLKVRKGSLRVAQPKTKPG